MKLQVAHEAYDYISLKLEDSYVTNVRLNDEAYGVILQHSVRNLRNNEAFDWTLKAFDLTQLVTQPTHSPPKKLPSISRSLHELNQFFYV